MTVPIPPDDRLTRRAPRTEMVTLICKNHPKLRWHTKNISGRSLFFVGEEGKKNHHGMIPPFKQAMKDLVAGRLEKRDTPLEYNPENTAMLANLYMEWEDEYGFECECPARDLVLHPMYDSGEDVPA